MLNKKELSTIVILTIILGFSVSLHKAGGDAGIQFILPGLLGIFLAIMLNVFTKKITAFYLDTEIEIKTWEFKKWGMRAHDKFKKGFPAGIFFPLIFAYNKHQDF